MKARTVCCRKLVDAKKAPHAKNKWGEFLVCNNDCKEFLAMATKEQMEKLTKD